MTGFQELAVENSKLVETHDVLGGSSRGLGYVVNNHVGTSPKYRVVGPLPYMAMKIAYKWG